MGDFLDSRVRASPGMVIVAIGDAAAIAAFVAAGELSHGNPISAGVGTFLAFAASWIVVAVPIGAYASNAFDTVRWTVASVAIAWTLAAILGQFVRLVTVETATLAPTFVLVSIAIGMVPILAWRLLVSVARLMG